MYLAHGWPRALDLDLPGQPVAAFHDGSVVVLVTSGGLGLWSAGAGGGGGGGLYFDGGGRGEASSSSSAPSSCSSAAAASSSGAPFRLATELAPRGETLVAALWRPARGGTSGAGGGGGAQRRHQRRPPALAVLSSAGVLRIYGVHFSGERRALPVSAPLLGGCYSGGSGDGGDGGGGGGGASVPASSDSEDPLTGAGPAAVDLYVTEEIDIIGMSSSCSGGIAEAGEAEGGGGEKGAEAGGLARPAALAGDATCILVALADGEVLSVTWQGDVRGRSRPFDGAAAVGGGTSISSSDAGQPSPPGSPPMVAAAAAEAAAPSSSPLLPLLSPSLPSPFPPPSAYRSPDQRHQQQQQQQQQSALVALHYCPLSRVAAAAFADGRVSLARAPASNPRPPAALGIPWDVREGGGGPSSRPVAVAVCGAADAVAVGTDLGDVELFSLSRTERLPPLPSGGAFFSSPASSPPFSPASAETASNFLEDGGEEAPPPAPPMRVLSARGGGNDDSEDDEEATLTASSHRGRRGAGPAAALAWSPCGGAVAVGWARGGLCCWTRAGCRLFSSRAVLSAEEEEEDEGQRSPPAPSPSLTPPPFRLEDGARALAWSPDGGGRLFVLQPPPLALSASSSSSSSASSSSPRAAAPPRASFARCLEIPLARALTHRSACAVAGMLADDALLLASTGDGSERSGSGGGGNHRRHSHQIHHPPSFARARPPQAYLSVNWPLSVASLSPDGRSAAVAGARGLALLTLSPPPSSSSSSSSPSSFSSADPTIAPRKWRLFGDVGQEARLAVGGFAWLPGLVVVLGCGPTPLEGGAATGAAGAGAAGAGAIAGGCGVLRLGGAAERYASIVERGAAFSAASFAAAAEAEAESARAAATARQRSRNQGLRRQKPSAPPADPPAGVPALHVYPRSHLDASSRLSVTQLRSPPLALDASAGEFVLAAFASSAAGSSGPSLHAFGGGGGGDGGIEIVIYRLQLEERETEEVPAAAAAAANSSGGGARSFLFGGGGLAPAPPLPAPLRARLVAVRELSVLCPMDSPPLFDAFLASVPPPQAPQEKERRRRGAAIVSNGDGDNVALSSSPSPSPPAPPPSPPPRHAVLLRRGGIAALLDLETGAEARLGEEREVDALWLPRRGDDGGGDGNRSGGVESPSSLSPSPWWGYGPKGIKMWLPSDVRAAADAAGGGLVFPSTPTFEGEEEEEEDEELLASQLSTAVSLTGNDSDPPAPPVSAFSTPPGSARRSRGSGASSPRGAGAGRRRRSSGGGSSPPFPWPSSPSCSYFSPKEPELEFDGASFPIAISARGDSAICVSQRALRSRLESKHAARGGRAGGASSLRASAAAPQPEGHASLPLFLPLPRVAPYLSAVLRRLLARGEAAAARRALQEALGPPPPEEGGGREGPLSEEGADREILRRTRRQRRRQQQAPHACVMRTAHALEWLLFTALEAACDEGGGGGGKKEEGEGDGGKGHDEGSRNAEASLLQTAAAPVSSPSFTLLSEVASLINHHPLHREILVSVARKTDAEMWPRLFAAAGLRPSQLASTAPIRSGSSSNLDAAAACLVLVDRVEGADAAHALAIRLLAAVLAPAFAREERGEEGEEERAAAAAAAAAAADAALSEDAALIDRAELAAELLRFIVPPAHDGSLPLPAGWGRGNAPSSSSTSSSSSSWWPSFLSSAAAVVAPFPRSAQGASSDPAPPGAPRGGAENAPAAEAAWRLFAAAARSLLSARRLRALASLSEALRGAGGNLAALLAATEATEERSSRPEQQHRGQRQQSGASALAAVSDCLRAFPLLLPAGRGSPSSPPRRLNPAAAAGAGADAAQEEAEAERERARNCLSLACAAERGDAALALALVLNDQNALGVITEAHPLLWADFLRSAAKEERASARLPARVAAAADEAAAAVEAQKSKR